MLHVSKVLHDNDIEHNFEKNAPPQAFIDKVVIHSDFSVKYQDSKFFVLYKDQTIQHRIQVQAELILDPFNEIPFEIQDAYEQDDNEDGQVDDRENRQGDANENNQMEMQQQNEIRSVVMQQASKSIRKSKSIREKTAEISKQQQMALEMEEIYNNNANCTAASCNNLIAGDFEKMKENCNIF